MDGGQLLWSSGAFKVLSLLQLQSVLIFNWRQLCLLLLKVQTAVGRLQLFFLRVPGLYSVGYQFSLNNPPRFSLSLFLLLLFIFLAAIRGKDSAV